MDLCDERTFRETTLKTLYIDMDDVICDFSKAHRGARLSDPDTAFPQSKPGFFLQLEPIENAIESVNELRDLFEVYVLTAPSTRNPHCYTEKRVWIENQFGYPFTKRLIINPNKGLMIGEFLIDDRVKGNGQDLFRGELIQFGSQRYPDWSTVMEYLKSCV